ncbi:MAG: M28 family metallopeptidase, partial [Marinicella sp.]
IILIFIIGISYVQAAVNINAGLSGTWHNNLIPGQGLFLDVIPANKTLFAGWFTYLPDSQAENNQYWLTLQGPYSGSVADLSIFKTTEGQFNDISEIQTIQVGIATLIFDSCTAARFNFQLDEFGIENSINLNRVTPDVFCSENSDNEPQQSSLNFPPEVAAISLSENNQSIIIQFSLFDPENDLMDLKLTVLGAQNQQHEIPVAYLQGHVNYPVISGEHKTISWDYLNDIGFQALNIDSFQIQIEADDLYVSNLQEIIDSVSEERLIADIQAIEGIRHYQSFPAGLTTARDHIKTQMTEHNLPFVEQVFNHLGSEGVNIIATLEAENTTQEVYIIDGHYDSVSRTPGADDNASGTAGMLEAMRVLSQFNSKKNIKFIAFDKEELGLVGSRYYANNITTGEQIKGLINFEMIGYTCREQPECVNFPNADTSIYNIKSNFANTLSDTFLQIGATHVPGLKITPVTDDGDSNFRRSDHAPFWDLGVDALFLTDGANFRTPHYHQVSDRLITLDTEFMTQVVKTAVGTLAILAEISHTGYAVSDTLELSAY